MINTGFKLTAKDLKKLADFKQSVAYGTYLKNVKNSPVYLSIMKEHAHRIDIEQDVQRLKSDGQLPDNISAEALTSLFRQSIGRMAINIVADSIILKELEDKSVDDILNGIKEDVNLLYLTGMADDKYYKEAQKQLENGTLDKNDVAYRGLMAWMKKQEKTPEVELPNYVNNDIQPKPVAPTTSRKKKELDLDSLNIDLGE